MRTQKQIETAFDALEVLRPVQEVTAALRALTTLLEQEPYVSGVERHAIIRAVFAAITNDDLVYYKTYRRPLTVGEKMKEERGGKRGFRFGTDERRDYMLRYNYGITLADFRAIIAAQSFSCAICKQTFRPPVKGEGRKNDQPHVDHRHSDGKIRGALCNNCNRGLGYFQDDPEVVQSAAEYLKKHI